MDPPQKKGVGGFIRRHMSMSVKVSGNTSNNVPSESGSPISPPPVMRAKSVHFQDSPDKQASRRKSLGAVEDLVQCPICLEKLNNPKMLPCQHTFCMRCLQSHIKDDVIMCLSCKTNYPAKSSDFVKSLPSNLYIDNLLNLLKGQPNEKPRPASVMPNAKIFQKRCCQCQSIIELLREYCCQHCKQTYCGVCWSAHIMELKSQIGSLVSQLGTGSTRLSHKLESFKDHNEWLVNQITSTAALKIHEIEEKRSRLLGEATELLKNGETSAEILQGLLAAMQKNVTEYVSNEFDTVHDDNEKVSAFMNFHRIAVDLLNDVAQWSEKKLSFDQDNFCIGEDIPVPEGINADEPLAIEVKGVGNPLENKQNMLLFYRSKNFVPKKIWKKCPRPAGVGIPPWSDYLYICNTDSHNIIIMDRVKGRIIDRISDSKMLCPQSIAFTKNQEEIFVSDKWNHCIHIFSKAGIYLRSIGSKGSKDGFFKSPEGIAIEPNECYLYVCDTGNDRIQVFDIKSGAFVRHIGLYTSISQSQNLVFTQLNAPTSIAAMSDSIVVADSGNRRIKTYSYSGEKLHEFGSRGVLKGQFQQPEAMSVDPMGFIIVGDSGNARIQIFEANGHLLRVFGGKGREAGQFGWISSVYISPQLEIIVSDTKNHQISIY